jgi:hypothetical protein
LRDCQQQKVAFRYNLKRILKYSWIAITAIPTTRALAATETTTTPTMVLVNVQS